MPARKRAGEAERLARKAARRLPARYQPTPPPATPEGIWAEYEAWLSSHDDDCWGCTHLDPRDVAADLAAFTATPEHLPRRGRRTGGHHA